MDTTTENTTCESFESNTSDSKTPESSIDCSKSSIFDKTDASSTKTSSNPFAPKSEIRVANLHPENLLHAGTKTHVAATMRQGYDQTMFHHKRDIASLHDEFAIKYLAHVASHPNLEVFEQQRNNLNTLEQEMFWPDMAIELDDPVEKVELGSVAGSKSGSSSGSNTGVNNKFIFVHSIILRRCKYFSDAIEQYKQCDKTFFPVIPVKNCLHKNVIEILRLFYCREISIDISDEKSVKDLQVLAKLFQQQDLDFAMTRFLRDQKFNQQNDLCPFKMPNKPMQKQNKLAMKTSKVPTKDKSSKYDPFGSLAKVSKAEHPKKVSDKKKQIKHDVVESRNHNKVDNEQVLKSFFRDVQKLQDEKKDGSGSVVLD